MRTWILLVVATTSCASKSDALAHAQECDPAKLGASVAAPTARSCGHTSTGQVTSPPWSCAVESFRAGKPFVITEDSNYMDTLYTTTLATAGDGALWQFRETFWPPGGEHRSTERARCGSARVYADSDGLERVHCEAVADRTSLCSD